MRFAAMSHRVVAAAVTAVLAILVATVGVGQGSAAGGKPAKVVGKTFNGVPVEEIGGKASGRARRPATPAAVLSTKVRIASGSVGPTDGRLGVIADGKRVPLRNGGRIELAGGLAAELFLDPYPPGRTRAWLDVHLFRAKTGAAVTNAVADMSYDMTIMTMGRFSGTARNTGDGHYLYTADYSMYGDWTHTLRLKVGKVAYELAVQVAALPGV